MTRLTVAVDTPARRATSLIVIGRVPSSTATPRPRPRRSGSPHRRAEQAGEEGSAFARDLGRIARPVGRVERLEAPRAVGAGGAQGSDELVQADDAVRRQEAVGVLDLPGWLRGSIVEMHHREAVDREPVERSTAARVPVARVEDENDALETGDDPAGQRGRIDRAVGEPEELERDPDAVRSGGIAQDREPVEHRPDRPYPLRSLRAGWDDEEVGGAQPAADLQARGHFGLEPGPVEAAIRPDLELDAVQAPDLARAHGTGGRRKLVGRAEEALRPDLDPVVAGLT